MDFRPCANITFEGNPAIAGLAAAGLIPSALFHPKMAL
ncbi:MAG: hypothetical protein ACI9MJ_000800 [Alphaproteobacteria bacterium]|jgi:hypothetical protein